MKSLTINGSKRESVGKKATKALRNAGQVPCVLYGGDEVTHFSAPTLAFKELVYTPDVYTVDLVLDDGSKANAVLQDIQFHPVTDEILHMDFYKFDDDQEITMKIPVQTEGIPRGVKLGGVLRFNLRRITVKGKAKNLPDIITADVTPLRIGQKLYVTAVESDDYTILHPENTVICQVRTSRTIAADEEDDEEEEGAEGAEGAEGEASEGDAKESES